MQNVSAARLFLALLVLTVAASIALLPGGPSALVVLGLVGIALTEWLTGLRDGQRFTLKNVGVLLLPIAATYLAAHFLNHGMEFAGIGTLYFARSGITGGGVLLNGSATPPTAVQASQIPTLKVQIVFIDANTQATITHNWGLDASAPTYLDPEIWYWLQNSTDGAPGATWLPVLTFDLTNTNVVLVNKIAGAAATPTGGTYIITLRRPVGPGM